MEWVTEMPLRKKHSHSGGAPAEAGGGRENSRGFSSEAMKGVRLQKVIAQAGLASRRAAEEMIRQGRVTVNGRVITELGHCVDPARKVYLLFYKPRQCVTTLRDPQGRRTVLDLIPPMGVRLFPVGRLDYDAEGLLLLTNDGLLGNRLQHPRYGVSKVYEVKVQGRPAPEALQRLRSGISLEEGTTSPAEVTVMRTLPRAAWLRIVLHQGWYRQIKRMMESVGHPVLKIKRVAYGPLTLGRFAPGDYRSLSEKEVQRLYNLVPLEQEQAERK
jgi:23S rRNA pseudouridine2605 synthase